MRIAYFVTNYPYNRQFAQYSYGGASVAAHNLAAEMAKRGHEIEVFTSSIDARDKIEKYDAMTIHRYGTNLRISTSNISLGIFKKPMDYDVDIAHVHFDIPPGPFAGLLYAKIKKVPLVVTYHGDWAEDFGSFLRRVGITLINRHLVDKILSHSAVIISPSRQYIDKSKFLQNHKERTVAIPNAIHLSDFELQYSKEECRKELGLPLDKKIILYFGFLTPYKGPDILIESMKRIIGEISDTILIFAGKGAMADELKVLAARLGVEKNVLFVGFVENNLKSLYYKAADIFCLPSTKSTESFGISNLEAMASGVPIVASNIGGIPDVVDDGINGLLVPPKNPEKLAYAIIYLLNNEETRVHMGKKGREKVQNYSWRMVAEETEKIYNEVLK